MVDAQAASAPSSGDITMRTAGNIHHEGQRYVFFSQLGRSDGYHSSGLEDRTQNGHLFEP